MYFNIFPKTFFPKFELPNLRCGLSASVAYLPLFTIYAHFCCQLAHASEFLAFTVNKSRCGALTDRLISCITNRTLQNLTTEGAFLWYDPDHNKCSKITQILPIKGTHASESYNVVQNGFKCSFDAPGFK